MRLRIIKSRNEIQILNSDEKLVHLAFHANNVDFLNLMQKCPRLRMIQVLPSHQKTLSSAIQVFFDMQSIELLQGDIRDHRNDLDEYFTIEEMILEEIHAMSTDGASMYDVAKRIQEKSRLGPDLIKYIAKNKIVA